jgi:hypothetical protein
MRISRDFKTLIFVGALLLGLVFPLLTHAGSFGDALGAVGMYFFRIGEGAAPLFIIANIISGAFALLGILALLFLIIGGFRYVTAYGNEEQAQAAKKTITYAIIGVAIAISAYTIVKLVAQALFKG